MILRNVRNAPVIKLLYILIISILILSGCKERKVASPGDYKGDLKEAQWITDSREWPSNDAEMYGDLPAPLFRKEFEIKEDIKSATLYITAAGYYSAFINGEKIGKNILDPAWSDFSKRIYYSEFDLTSELKKGQNVLGATLGNGFYNPLPLRMFGKYNLRKELP